MVSCLHWAKTCTVGKTTGFSPDQQFSKCGSWTSSISVTWELVASANDQASAWDQKPQGRAQPSICVSRRSQVTPMLAEVWEPPFLPARASKILKEDRSLNRYYWWTSVLKLCHWLPLPSPTLLKYQKKVLMKKFICTNQVFFKVIDFPS